ncbi:MarR family winged helix-turn-helix transcriptional regulator [Nocardia bovistercoris]|uniref:MarR family transcriptional regulator n=1 Tax=Nocardia bovistercoris TaxID=2785916 RepID=A0A931ICB3_9NOCA|nr:MarR family transcriptional regulator [Nocardia bovistercoris]MBH0779022.1 MarR family transcriptional regulator [Nocardia bovistercoris]
MSKTAPQADRRTVTPTERVDEWRRLLDRHAAVSCALEKGLQGQHGIGLSEFETLDRLMDANCDDYRMSDLAGDIHLSQSALSRAVARLERDGLVHRSMCVDDRRAIFVCPTEEGRAVHARALPTHRAILAETWDRVRAD